jgi:acetyltransferase-like isoleucine patch superfamily enzyme
VTTGGSESSGGPAISRAQDDLFAADSARAKYQSLIVGRSGFLALAKYELVTTLTQWVPGALGLALRKVTYPWLLGRVGRNVVFGQNVVIRHPHKIAIGDNVVIDDNCLLDAKGHSNRGIAIGNGVFVGRNTILSSKNGDIELGDRANVGFNCEIFSASRVTVGAGTLIAAYTYLVGGDHDAPDRGLGVLEQGRRSRGIEVGAGVWLGAGVTVLDGVSIGDRAVVGAHSVVRADVPGGATVAGAPARRVDAPAAPEARP